MMRASSVKHVILKRRISYEGDSRAPNEERELEGRDPSLINLPVPLPSIPLLSPVLDPVLSVLSPVVGGLLPTTSASTAAAAATTSSSASSGAASSGGGSGGSSSGGSSSGGSSGSGSSGGGGSSSGGSGSSSGGSSGSTGSTSSGGSSGGGSSGTASSGGGSSGTASTGGDSSNPGSSDGVGSSAGSGSSGSSAADSSAISSVNRPGSAAATSSSSKGAQDLSPALPAATGVIDNAATGNSSSSSAGSASSGSVVNSTETLINVAGFSSSSSTAWSSTVTAATGSSTAAGVSTTASVSSGTSKGGSSGTGSGSDSPSDNANSSSGSQNSALSSGSIAAIVVSILLFLALLATIIIRKRIKARAEKRRKQWNEASPGYGSTAVGSGTRSARSSFGSGPFRSSLPLMAALDPFADPQSPQVEQARFRDNSNVIVVTPPPPVAVRDDNPFSNANRYSRETNASSNSQLLMLPDRDPDDLASPMSVRPFSPSESFAFPRPPGSDWGGGNARDSRTRIESTSTVLRRDSTSTLGISEEAAAAPYIENPFSDSAEDLGSTKGFAKYETISRPFLPTLADEVAVAPGETVKVLKTFDDGWAMVETCQNEGSKMRGLIPVDCFRQVGEDVPDFLTGKRVSSYEQSQGLMYA